MFYILLIVYIYVILTFIVSLFKGIHNPWNIGGIFLFLFMIAYDYASTKGILAQYTILDMILSAIVSLFWIDMIICTLFMISGKRKKDEQTAKYAIILGCRVKNGKPSKMLMQRIYEAFDLYDENHDIKFILSGGQGKDETISEAECMKNELVKRGVPSEQIICEDKSTNTIENITFSKQLLDGDTAYIVTNEFHMARTAYIARKAGLKVIPVDAMTSWYSVPCFWLREAAAIDMLFLFGKNKRKQVKSVNEK